MKIFTMVLVAAFLAVGPAFLYGQDAPKKEEPKTVEAVLSEFTGTVDVKKAGENDWVPAEKGMKLKEGSEVCTGYSSTAVLDFSGNIKVDVASLSSLKIDVNALKGKKADTTLKVEFGQIELDVKKGEIESNVKVSTPNSTTSISGTRVAVRSFSDEVPRGGAGPQHAAVRVSQGTVTVFSNVTETAMAVTAGEATTTELHLAQEVERIFIAITTAPPLVGATQEEVGVSTGTSAAAFDTGTVGVVVGGDLTADTSPVVGERIVAQQVPVLPGPPPMPGAVAKPK